MRAMPAITAAGLLALVLAGCMETMPHPGRPGRPKPQPPVRYSCDNGQTLVVDYRPGVAIVRAGGSRLRLPQSPSGSGFDYGDARHNLRGKGGEVMWTVGRMVPIRCRATNWPEPR